MVVGNVDATTVDADTIIGTTANITTVNVTDMTISGNITTDGNIDGDLYVGGTVYATAFDGDGSNISGLTTDIVAEGANLYYTDARSRAAISSTGNITYDANTGVIGESLTTTDIDEGDNLYFTTDRANTAIDDYVVGSENIDVASGVISLTNALGNVNSITSETDTAMTLYGEGGIELNQKIDSTESRIVDINTTGYSLADPTLPADFTVLRSISNGPAS